MEKPRQVRGFKADIGKPDDINVIGNLGVGEITIEIVAHMSQFINAIHSFSSPNICLGNNRTASRRQRESVNYGNSWLWRTPARFSFSAKYYQEYAYVYPISSSNLFSRLKRSIISLAPTFQAVAYSILIKYCTFKHRSNVYSAKLLINASFVCRRTFSKNWGVSKSSDKLGARRQEGNSVLRIILLR
jgi:hypothetical protein